MGELNGVCPGCPCITGMPDGDILPFSKCGDGRGPWNCLGAWWIGVGLVPPPWILCDGWLRGKPSCRVVTSSLFILRTLMLFGPFWDIRWAPNKLSPLFASSKEATLSVEPCACCSNEWVSGLPSLMPTSFVMPPRTLLEGLSMELPLCPNSPVKALLPSSLVIIPFDINCWGDNKAVLSTNGCLWGVQGAEWGSVFDGLAGDPAFWLNKCRGNAGSELTPLLRLENGIWGDPGKGLKAVGFCNTGEPSWVKRASLDLIDLGEARRSCCSDAWFTSWCLWNSAPLMGSPAISDCTSGLDRGEYPTGSVLSVPGALKSFLFTEFCSSGIIYFSLEWTGSDVFASLFGVFWSMRSCWIFLMTEVGIKERSMMRGLADWEDTVLGFTTVWPRCSGGPPGVTCLSCCFLTVCGLTLGGTLLGWRRVWYTVFTWCGTICKLTAPNPRGGLCRCWASMERGEGDLRSIGDENSSWGEATRKKNKKQIDHQGEDG